MFSGIAQVSYQIFRGVFFSVSSVSFFYYFLFFNKIYLQYVNTLTAVLDNTKIVPGQPISCRTLAVRGGHGTTSSGYGRYMSEKKKWHKRKKTLQQFCVFLCV
jgi:hypothetical protein